MSNSPRSILVVDASPFGRSLAVLALAHALRQAYPTSFLTAATSKGACELLLAHGLADAVIDLGLIKKTDHGLGSSLKRFAQLIHRARGYDVDLVLDLSSSAETQALSRFVLRARTVTPSRLSNIIDAVVGRAKGKARHGDHLAECRSVLGQLGIELVQGALTITPPDEENKQFEQLLSRKGSRGGEPIVVLHGSNANDPHSWPAGSFAELGVMLANSFGARIIAADDPFSNDFADSLKGLLPSNAITLREPRSLEFIAAIARASVLVTDDSGVARLAVDLGTPVVELAEGDPHPPCSQTHRVIGAASTARIPTDDVYQAASEMIQENRSVSLFHR